MKNPKMSLLLIGLGIVFFISGAALKAVQDQQKSASKPIEVKEQSIPLSAEDFNGEDPRIQGAIQQQIQQQQGSVQNTGREGGSTGDSQLLQPVPTGLQGTPDK